MTSEQQTVLDWFCRGERHAFITDIIELEGNYESIPENVQDAFNGLSYMEQIALIGDAAKRLHRD